MKFITIAVFVGIMVFICLGVPFFRGFYEGFSETGNPYPGGLKSDENNAVSEQAENNASKLSDALTDASEFFSDLDITKLQGLPSTNKEDIFETFYDTNRAKAIIKFRGDRDFICEAASNQCRQYDPINQASFQAKTVWYAWDSQTNKLGGLECQNFEGGCLTKSPASVYIIDSRELKKFDYTGQAINNSFSPSISKFLAFDYGSGKVNLYSLGQEPRLERQIDMKDTIGSREGGRVTALAWNNDESKVAIAVDSYPATIFLLDLASDTIKLLFEDDRASFDWNRVDFTDNGTKIVFTAGQDYKMAGQKAVDIVSGNVSQADVEYKVLRGGNFYNAYYQITAEGLEVGEANEAWKDYSMEKPSAHFKYPPSLKPCNGTASGILVHFARTANSCDADSAAMMFKDFGSASGFSSIAQMAQAINENKGSDKQFLPDEAYYSDIDSSEIIDINGRQALKVQEINQFLGEGYWVIYFFDGNELFAIYNYKPGMLATLEFVK